MTRKDLALGSCNAPHASFHDKASDKYIMFPGLFSINRSQRRRTIDALLDFDDKKIIDIVEKRMGKYNVANFLEVWEQKRAGEKQKIYEQKRRRI